ncbi:UDP-N-acetylmuramoyl-L-alanyl-D-glutamate--2,6-diaminopimelate ligase [Sphingobacterium mizutaii NBRC 14946 = DSM 11724]|uniref:UDP-N-acetylmuramoyl-L-alanyl-D-glutamate--2,6-diaminopimelate ligase n=2 Tax=Sphingobacterium mizutaii TaxID=1010 RepID=A0AAJ4XDS7_9SPHI|nr:UDP-N-acetylmuramoyl-L-alanyl-D-glutamate--2,6-diaminopimelate ligase [Sphingobacterium mizutaii]GEM67332.1 UDP-N-acetylmuramoyl-L-alanyl-D-glutamate--2,6-diaminopimelate ligase [Sphingobacterium mizutaii NBRC 14946 = DSM 11724]SDL31185.1 UDP-N-acetylmuramoylalanyl-D-glutamate--2,6-diaminopimelate ligase [Sphingobacterium mizutaii]SNV54536.1 UDP-N-acetylmuramoyl-L-alanyl-D-glutamate--LD-lysine ligase [Sphingobacterium mizutaii]
MLLKELLHAIPVIDYRGSLDTEVSALCLDSRKAVKGSAFVAVRGHQTDGHLFVNKAIELGASVVLVEELPEEIKEDVVYVVVGDSAYALGVMASTFYGNPSSKLKLVGVTGTNGKTTVATLLFNLFSRLGFHVGLLSTVQNQIGERVVEATHTTPDPISLNSLLKEMVEDGCDYCFMEVSSHAVVQQRIAGLKFAGGIFTNITHDHLDFHGTFANYIKAKKKFFDDLDRYAFALTNIDDKNGQVMLQNTFAHKKTYGLHQMADFKAKILESHFDGMLLQVDGQEVWVKLVGDFNAYNLLAVYGASILLEQETVKVLMALSEITGAEGRFETMKSSTGVVAIVDYAHTPDAVENVLETIGGLRKPGQQILTVLGCGGDRDKTKRPEMAEVASRLSDKVVLTSDNPRTEDPATIIKEMEVGISADKRKNVFSITDRREAIRAAFHLAQPGDVILVAGKGHEKYQDINGVKNHFDDKEELIKIFNEHN